MRLIHPASDDVLHDVDRGPVVLDRNTAAFAAHRDHLEHLVQQLAVRKAHDVVVTPTFEAHHRIQSYIVHLSSSASLSDAPSHPDPVNCWVLCTSFDGPDEGCERRAYQYRSATEFAYRV